MMMIKGVISHLKNIGKMIINKMVDLHLLHHNFME